MADIAASDARLFGNAVFSDAVLSLCTIAVVGDKRAKTECGRIHVSRKILATRSTVFYAIFTNGPKVPGIQKVEVDINQDDRPAFENMLRLMYAPVLRDGLTLAEITPIISMADVYGATAVKRLCVDYIGETGLVQTYEGALAAAHLLCHTLDATLRRDISQEMVDHFFPLDEFIGSSNLIVPGKAGEVNRYQEFMGLPFCALELLILGAVLLDRPHNSLFSAILRWQDVHVLNATDRAQIEALFGKLDYCKMSDEFVRYVVLPQEEIKTSLTLQSKINLQRCVRFTFIPVAYTITITPTQFKETETWNVSVGGFAVTIYIKDDRNVMMRLNNDVMGIDAEENAKLIAFTCVTYAFSDGAWEFTGNLALDLNFGSEATLTDHPIPMNTDKVHLIITPFSETLKVIPDGPEN